MRGRRDLLKAAIGLSFFTQEDPASLRPKEGDLLVKSSGATRIPLAPDDIPVAAAPTLAWAMDPGDQTVRSGSRLNQLLLVRLDVEKLAPDTRARAAGGVVAYTVICTHNGCDIDDWLASEQLVSCSCHASSFDPKDGGKVVEGPAPRVLPALPLRVVDGKLVVASAFTSPVGYEKG
jgi:Rieske Fe-S protein